MEGVSCSKVFELSTRSALGGLGNIIVAALKTRWYTEEARAFYCSLDQGYNRPEFQFEHTVLPYAQHPSFLAMAPVLRLVWLIALGEIARNTRRAALVSLILGKAFDGGTSTEYGFEDSCRSSRGCISSAKYMFKKGKHDGWWFVRNLLTDTGRAEKPRSCTEKCYECCSRFKLDVSRLYLEACARIIMTASYNVTAAYGRGWFYLQKESTPAAKK